MKKPGRTAPTCALIAICVLTLIAPSLHAHVGGVRLPSSFTAEAMGSAEAAARPDASAPASADEEVRRRAAEQYGKLPLVFEANQGQLDRRVKYTSRGRGYNLFLTETEAVLALSNPAGRPRAKQPSKATAAERAANKVEHAVLRMRPVGASPNPQVSGADEQPGKSNYFVGADPGKWRRDVPTYGRVEYRGVYPGVDMVYYGNQGQLEYDFVVAPGVDPRVIRLRMEGAKGIRIDKNGELVVGTAAGEVRQRKPMIYQEVSGERREVEGRYVLLGRRDVGFRVGRYDRGHQLVIDPVLSYATYLGSNDYDEGSAIAVDAQGNAYITGTFSVNFPVTSGAFQTTLPRGVNVFVAKLNPEGTDLVFSTYLGGNNAEYPSAITVDVSGNVYVVGGTLSSNFPTTPGAFSTTPASSDSEIFITKLSSTGAALVYSTLLGGKNEDGGGGIAVDGAGTAYVTGGTKSSDFPTTVGAYKTSVPCCSQEAFITRLNATGTGLLYSTYLGGRDTDSGSGIAIDGEGNAYVAGNTWSDDFPTTATALQKTIGDLGPSYGSLAKGDAFVTKLNSAGTALVYSTYLGGIDKETSTGIAIDTSDNAYVVGSTKSVNFSTTPGAMLTGNGGVFKSVNGGAVWGAVNNGITTDAITCIAVNRITPSTLYAGTEREGVYRSTDSGGSWMPINAGIENIGIVNTLAVDPVSPSTIYLGSQSTGPFKSTDAGETWNSLETVLDSANVASIVIDPVSPSTVYVAGNGVFKSTDNGATWEAINTGLEQASPRALAIDPSTPSTIYAGIWGSSFQSLYKSTNGGATWMRTAFPLHNERVLSLAISTTYPPTLYVGTEQGVYHTTDGGETWRGDDHGVTGKIINALATHPTDSQIVYAGTASGIFKSTDGGINWSLSNRGAKGLPAYGITVDPMSPSVIYAATRGASSHGFAAKLNSAGNGLLYSTLLETGIQAEDIALDSSGHAYVLEDTPAVVKLNTSGTDMVYRVFLRGGGSGGGIAADAAGSAYVVGTTSSFDLPVTPGAYQNMLGHPQNAPGQDAFVVKVLSAPTVSANVGVTQTVGVYRTTWETRITFVITVTNHGPDFASGVTVTSTLPDSLDLYDCFTSTSGCYGFGNRTYSGFFSIAPNESVTHYAVGVLKCSVPEGTLISNTAKVESSTPDPDDTNNTATVSLSSPEWKPFLTPSSSSFTSSGGRASFEVQNSGCPLTATTDADWISITSIGYNMIYSVAANTGPDRIGTITVQGQKFTVFQSSPTNSTFGMAGRVSTSDLIGIPGVTMTFSRVTSGAGPVPPPVQTDADGYWSQSGFERGVTYLATPSKKRYTFSPPNRLFAASSISPTFTGKKNADTAGVFRPSNGSLYLKNANDTGFADLLLTYGLPGDYPISGDWDGDGIDTIGIYRQGTFYLRNSNTNGFGDIVVPFGSPGDQPVVGDWDGDGVDTIGVYRQGTFMLRNSNTAGVAEVVFGLGIAGDIGIAGDWDGDGVVTTGVFRPSNGALYLKNANSTGFADLVLTYGLPGDKPIVGDWNGDGVDTIGVYRGGTFMLRNSNTNGFAQWVFTLGIPEDHPISGDWNGLP